VRAWWLGQCAGAWEEPARRCHEQREQNYGKAQSLQSDAQDYVTAGNAVFIAGGVLAALGTVLYFVGAPDGRAAAPDTHAY